MQTDLPGHRRNNPASLGAPPLKRSKNLLRTPADARSALAIRTIISFAYGFRFRLWPVIIADLQHTAMSAVVITVPAVLRLAVFTVICHGVHPPENGYKKSASVQP